MRVRRQNKGQGLGFKVAGKVVDKPYLAKVAGQLFGGLVTVVTALLALAATSAAPAAGVSECALSAAQAGSIRAAMTQHNASCAYKMSLGSILLD